MSQLCSTVSFIFAASSSRLWHFSVTRWLSMRSAGCSSSRHSNTFTKHSHNTAIQMATANFSNEIFITNDHQITVIVLGAVVAINWWLGLATCMHWFVTWPKGLVTYLRLETVTGSIRVAALMCFCFFSRCWLCVCQYNVFLILIWLLQLSSNSPTVQTRETAAHAEQCSMIYIQVASSTVDSSIEVQDHHRLTLFSSTLTFRQCDGG